MNKGECSDSRRTWKIALIILGAAIVGVFTYHPRTGDVVFSRCFPSGDSA